MSRPFESYRQLMRDFVAHFLAQHGHGHCAETLAKARGDAELLQGRLTIANHRAAEAEREVGRLEADLAESIADFQAAMRDRVPRDESDRAVAAAVRLDAELAAAREENDRLRGGLADRRLPPEEAKGGIPG